MCRLLTCLCHVHVLSTDSNMLGVDMCWWYCFKRPCIFASDSQWLKPLGTAKIVWWDFFDCENCLSCTMLVVRRQCAVEFYVTHMTRFQNSRFVYVWCIWLHFEYSSISRFSQFWVIPLTNDRPVGGFNAERTWTQVCFPSIHLSIYQTIYPYLSIIFYSIGYKFIYSICWSIYGDHYPYPCKIVSSASKMTRRCRSHPAAARGMVFPPNLVAKYVLIGFIGDSIN